MRSTAAKAAPNTVSYATGGAGSSGHLAAELFARRAGVTLVHVPFRGSPPAIQSLHLRRRAAALGYADRGDARLYRAEADEGARRDDARAAAGIPDIPAIGEAGLGDDLDVQAWQGVLVRAGTPPETIATLHKAIVQAMSLPDTRARIEAMSVEPMATDPAAFDAFFKSEVTRWTEVARRAGLTVQ